MRKPAKGAQEVPMRRQDMSNPPNNSGNMVRVGGDRQGWVNDTTIVTARYTQQLPKVFKRLNLSEVNDPELDHVELSRVKSDLDEGLGRAGEGKREDVIPLNSPPRTGSLGTTSRTSGYGWVSWFSSLGLRFHLHSHKLNLGS